MKMRCIDAGTAENLSLVEGEVYDGELGTWGFTIKALDVFPYATHMSPHQTITYNAQRFEACDAERDEIR
jgi:hypothetical protein